MPQGSDRPANKERIKKSLRALLAGIALLLIALAFENSETREKLLATFGAEPRILIYPPADRYDPNPSPVHDTWGRVNLSVHPDAMALHLENSKRFASSQFALSNPQRLRHPTIIWRYESKPGIYYISIDGSNEMGPRDTLAHHTTEGKLPFRVLPGHRVFLRHVGGTLSYSTGHPARWDIGYEDEKLHTAPGEYERYTLSDGFSVSALIARLRTENGKTTPWHKFCYAGVPCVRPRQIGILNDLGEPAQYVDLYHNRPKLLTSFNGKPYLTLEFASRGTGWNGDRLELEMMVVR